MATFNATKIADAVLSSLGLTVPPERRDQLAALVRREAGHCLANCADDEPIFVLVARDVTAPNVVRMWASDAEMENVPQEKVDGAREVALAMNKWKGRKKRPD